MKVLLVEDDKFHARYLYDTVREALPEATEILCAANGREGAETARRAQVGAAVMDLHMPDRNGVDAARAIWAERPETRILFWSNYSDEAYLRGIARIVPAASSYGYVLKTAAKARLQLALRAVLLEGQIVVDQEVHRAQQRHIRTHDALTDSEHAVLLDMALGLPDKAIAERTGLSLRTVQNRLLSLYDKLGVTDLPAGPGLPRVNKRTRAISRALSLRAINTESLDSAEQDLRTWLEAQSREARGDNIAL